MQAVALGTAVLLTLPGAVAAAEPPAEPTPSTSPDEGSGDTVISSLSLQLSPPEGAPGTSFSALVTKAGINRICTLITLSWTYGTQLAALDLSTDTAEATFVVPAGTEAGSHPVTASCEGATPDTAQFTVLAPTPDPTLELSSPDGPPAAQITASGNGFACEGAQVRLVWDDGTVATTTSGSFTRSITGPSTAGDHRLTASCTDNPEIAAEAPFTVTEPVTSTTSGTTTDIAPATTTVPVPVTENANPPVNRPPTPPPPPQTSVPTWLVALLAIAAALAASGYRALRKQREAALSARVHTVVHPDRSPAIGLHEAPGQRSHTIRLDFVRDGGTHTIREAPR